MTKFIVTTAQLKAALVGLFGNFGGTVDLSPITKQLTAMQAQQASILKEILNMAAQQDALNAAIAGMAGNIDTLTANISAHDVAVQAELVALQNAIAVGDPAAMAASVQKISDMSSAIATGAATIASETGALKSSLPPA